MTVTVFVDLDSTLVENRFSRKAIGPLLQQIADAAGLPIETVGQAMAAENTRRQESAPDHPLTMDWDDIVRTIAQQYGVTLPETVDARWQQVANAADVEILDDAPSMLRRLKDAGYRLVIATKGLSKYQDPVLDVTGLRPYFDDILTPDITGYLKTSPAYFARYADEQNITRFFHVGDHYYDDVICARRNGFTSILRAPIPQLEAVDPLARPAQLAPYVGQIKTYPDDGSDTLPDAVVLSLQEVPDVIARFLYPSG